uniref:Uncharacterized protein n=1 Tax=Caenorhabditis japonica TaxID=281687 RepID=A0A8R1IQ94_CAEJA
MCVNVLFRQVLFRRALQKDGARSYEGDFSPLISQSPWLNWTQQEISLPSSTGRSPPSCRTTTSKQHQGDQLVGSPWIHDEECSTPRKLLMLLVVSLRCSDAPMQPYGNNDQITVNRQAVPSGVVSRRRYGLSYE